MKLDKSSIESIKAIIRRALLVASAEDDLYDRELGPIHFIKYVYLADMEYAKYNDGKTFTGVDWTFYRFGPWSQEVNSCIEPALNVLGIVREKRQSSYGEDDYIRWRVDDEGAVNNLVASTKLPLTVTATVDKYVHKFRNDTSALLHFTYATLPILNAAPNEPLDFSVMVDEEASYEADAESAFLPLLDRLSKSKKKKLTSRMDELRQSLEERVKSTERPATKGCQPDFDSVYEEGMKWLADLAGPSFPEDDVPVKISDSVWKSGARRGE